MAVQDQDREESIPLTEAARALRMSSERARRRLLTGDLDGWQANGRWYITRTSLDRLVRRSAKRHT